MISALKIDNLWKHYGKTPVVKGLSLSIEPGEIFGLLGPNGAGKSTSINLISGVGQMEKGTIEVFGLDNRTQYRQCRQIVGVMHQEIVVDSFFTIDKALKIHSGYYGIPDDPKWRHLLIERLGLGPHLHKHMLKLSGGLKRRFMVAKALIHKPRLLILDEPTAGVDVELRRGLWELVREINSQGTTVLLTTHYLEEAQSMCGRIAIMNHGDLVALEETSKLLSRMPLRKVTVELDQPAKQIPPGLTHFTPLIENDGTRIIFNLSAQQKSLDLFRALEASDLQVADMLTEKPGLEEVFIHLTGLGQKQDNS